MEQLPVMWLLAPESTSQWSAWGECDERKEVATPADSGLGVGVAAVPLKFEVAAALALVLLLPVEELPPC